MRSFPGTGRAAAGPEDGRPGAVSAELPVITAEQVRRALRERAEIALLDVRPEVRHATGHPLFAASFPASRLELEVYDRLPRSTVRIAVYGDEPDDAARAARTLLRLGYRDVSVLAGGLAGWPAAGGVLFRDVNAPSKAFGELVAATAGTPGVTAGELSALLHRDSDVAVLDARRFEEYQTMSIPTATSVPGAELVLHASTLAPDPATTIVVNCAARTRSIIGAQSLINAGLPNRVVALHNGTTGWTLAGLALEHGRDRRAPGVSAAAARQAARAARAVARRAGVRRIRASWLRTVLDGGQRTVYRFDVRSPEEYQAGHLAGFRPAPGGQLVQETDWFAPVRGALLVLAEDDGGRAAMTASWLAQMGWEVVILRDSPAAGPPVPGPWAPAFPHPPMVPLVTPADLEAGLRAGWTRVIDVDSSKQFLAGHVPGAAWAPRADLPALAHSRRQTVLTSTDGTLAAFAAADLSPRPAVLDGGTGGWARSGRPLEAGPGGMLSSPADVYRRPYEGTGAGPAAMQAYLDWECGLVAQLEQDGTHGFSVLT